MTEPLPSQMEAALRYASIGFEVFPANPRTKTPLTTNGMNDATTDAEQIKAWWTQHPDALVACRIPDDQVVLDIDPRHGGDKTWTELESAYATILSARAHRSGRGDGGTHHWFKRPPGKLSARKLDKWAEANGVGHKVSDTKWSSGIDILHHNHRYSILPPSLHPVTGKPYLWTHKDEPAEMPSFLAALIIADPTPEPAPQIPPQFPTSDSIADWFTDRASWNDILPAAGWTVVQGDGNADGSKWKHPSATAASSASVRHGCLFVYSPNTDFPETEPSDPHGITKFRAWSTLNYRGDMSAAARAAGELRDGPRPAQVDLASLIAKPPSTTGRNAGLNLPDSFWNSRASLQHIRQAAHSKLTSADAVLIATLARVVTLVPANVTLPATIGGQVSLNLFTSIVDPSGGGKSASVSVARKLVPIIRQDIVDPILPSSGEGLIEAFMGTVEEEQRDGKKRKVRRQVMNAGFAFVDEGQGLLAQSDRSGNTIMETIRSAWMGGDLGQHNATDDRKRWLKEHQYRLCMVIGFQLAFAAHLIGDGEGGTPQRFTFALGTDLHLTGGQAWPGPLTLDHWPIGRPCDIVIDESINQGIRDRRLATTKGERVVDPLDAHADLRRLKLAAALGVLENRLTITEEDWELAGAIDEMSCAVRTLAIRQDQMVASATRTQALRIAVEREEALENAVVERTIRRVSLNVARKVWREGPMTAAAAFRVVHSRDRMHADQEAVIAAAVAAGWLSIDGENVARGASDPT